MLAREAQNLGFPARRSLAGPEILESAARSRSRLLRVFLEHWLWWLLFLRSSECHNTPIDCLGPLYSTTGLPAHCLDFDKSLFQNLSRHNNLFLGQNLLLRE